METLSLSAVMLLFFRKARSEDAAYYKVPGALPLMLFLGYMILQVMPLPSGFVELVSPGTYALYRETAATGEPVKWCSLSIDKKATISEFYRMASYAAFYVLTVQLLANKDLLKRTVAVVTILAAAISCLAMLQHVFSNNRIFWFRELTQGGNPFGPYVNRNHYAGLMEMTFPLALGLFLFYRPGTAQGTLRGKIAEISNSRGTSVHILAGLAVLSMATSVFLSLSRSGIISLCLSVILFGAALSLKLKKGGKGALAILAFIPVLYTVGWFGWDPVFKRFEGIQEAASMSELRLNIWKDGLNMIRDFPLTGTGFGSFAGLYPKYNSTTNVVVEHAHNDYIELLAEGGLAGLLLFLWFVASVLITAQRAFMKRRGLYSVYIYTGAFTGIMAIMIHSITDFNMHIGANGLYFAFLAGLAVSAAHTRMHDREGDTLLGKTGNSLVKYGFIPAAVILITGLVFNTGILIGDYLFPLRDGGRINGNTAPEVRREAAYDASFFDPLEAGYHFAIAGIEWDLSNGAAAVTHYEKALRLHPSRGEYLQGLGWAVSGQDRHDAVRLFLAGIRYDRQNPGMYSTYGAWLLEQGDKEAGIENIRNAILLGPERTREYIALMVLKGLSDGEIKNALPGLVGPHLDFADYLFNTQQEKLADREYLGALNYIGNEKEPKPSFFYRPYKYYSGRNLQAEALMVMEKAVAALPGNMDIRLAAAEAYVKAGDIRRAAGEYKRVLAIDPGNRKARERLDKLR